MATLVLSLAGQAIGAALGSPLLGTIGRAAGAIVGYGLDQALFGKGSSTVREGPRLSDLEVQASSEGAPIPRVYGRARIGGQIIWATRFEEVTETTTTTSGGKGGGGSRRTQTEITYSYYANMAIGLCEGPIARVGRIWADGDQLDLTDVTYRVYTGTESQSPDSLIEAKQGAGVPAYRGLAYVVFERLPLAEFGNRVPQLNFEVTSILPGLETRLNGINLIPGASEFGYDPQALIRTVSAGSSVSENAHSGSGASDWTTALDDLQAVCPNLQQLAIVVTWFGTDLRVGQCQLRPAVENREKVVDGAEWRVGDVVRSTAELVSTYLDRPAFGGTPSDAAVIAAIQNLKARGLKVVLNPFVMMDIPAGNTLPDPWSGLGEQPPYPWRGTITCDPAPGRPGSPDQTGAVIAQLDAFIGAAAVGDFTVNGTTVSYSGPAEWSLRRMVLHYAHLSVAAGGVDTFLLGSELVALTQLRSAPDTYPFVAALSQLADDVRSVVGSSTEISYGADWSEYFGHQPQDGSGDVYFHLDSLWANANIDFIGIDNYMPLADWRDGDAHLDAEIADSAYDNDYLQGNIAGGEGFDWYYASDADRTAQLRTPITDTTYGKPWVFRYKDLVNWWSNQHFNRPLGVEAAQPTAWVPQSKPIKFTETGCPAVDKGANQSNVFPDPKSSSSSYPYFSNRSRDDEAQRAFLNAVVSYWDPDDPDYDPARNPVSSVYGDTMVDAASIFAWTWDARPYPAFPALREVWSDGGNWTTGHWLNGRLGTAPLAALIAAICERQGFADYDVTGVYGVLDGYVIDRPMSAREAIDPLIEAGLVEALDAGTVVRFFSRGRRPELALTVDDLVDSEDRPLVTVTRAQETELPLQLTLGFTGDPVDFRRSAVSSRRLAGSSRREARIELAAMMEHGTAKRTVESRLHDLWVGRERISFSLAPSEIAIEPGDVLRLERNGVDRAMEIVRIDEAGQLSIEARAVERSIGAPVAEAGREREMSRPVVYGKPSVHILDLPILNGGVTSPGARIAAFADPWPGRMAVYRSPSEQSFTLLQMIDQPATIGTLATPLAAGRLGLWDRVNQFEVELQGGALAGQSELLVQAGANIAAVGSAAGGWEILQFRDATLIAENTYRLSWLLRGQAGTEDVMHAGHSTGADFVLIDAAAVEMPLRADEIGRLLYYRIGPAVRTIADPSFRALTQTLAGRAGLPFSPSHLKAVKDYGSGDIALAWTRRTRIGGDAWLGEVPLGEDAEAYDVLIYDGETVKRTLNVDGPQAIYAADDQSADFGAPLSTVDFAVHQLSATHGRGVPRRAAIEL